MTSKLLYKVQEKTIDGKITCTFYTQYFFMAIADMMLKAKRPLNGKVCKKIYSNEVSVVSIQHNTPLEHPYILSMETNVFDKEINKLKYQVIISTLLAPEDVYDGIGLNSDPAYLVSSYYNSIVEVAYRAKYWTKGDMNAAKVLAVFASRDSEHLFWSQFSFGSKMKSLSM
jgi:hypothetical protein